MPAKKNKPEKNVKLDDDEALGDILQDLEKEPDETIKPLQPTVLMKKKKVNRSSYGSPINKFSKSLKETVSPASVKLSPKPIQNFAVKENLSSPKAKRSLQPPDDSTLRCEDESELMDVDFSNDMDEMDDLAQALEDDDNDFKEAANQVDKENKNKMNVEVKKEVPKSKPEEILKPNRGFTAKANKDEGLLATGWETVKGNMNESVLPEIQIDSSKLPLITNSDGEQVIFLQLLDNFCIGTDDCTLKITNFSGSYFYH